MPNYILKAEPDVDWYCRWSTIVDAPTDWGTREELTRSSSDPQEVTPERFERADRNGTSARWPGSADADQPFGWRDSSFILSEAGPAHREGGWWALPRENLRKFCEALDADQDTTSLCVWTAFEPTAGT